MNAPRLSPPSHKLSLSSVEVLRRARARIEDPAHWTTGALARIERSDPEGVEPTDLAATCWCALGAVRAEAGGFLGAAEDLLCEALPEDYDADDSDEPEPVADYNDHHATHADVLALFDRAIVLAEVSP